MWDTDNNRVICKILIITEAIYKIMIISGDNVCCSWNKTNLLNAVHKYLWLAFNMEIYWSENHLAYGTFDGDTSWRIHKAMWQEILHSEVH